MNLLDAQVAMIPALAGMAASAAAGAIAMALYWLHKMQDKKNLVEFLGGIYDTKPENLEEILNDLLTHKSIPLRGTPDDFILPGWFCPRCEIFNGEAKETRTECRVCDLRYIRSDSGRNTLN